MRKGLVGVLMLSGALFILNSCKDDPEPNTNISFEKSEEATTESDGTIKSFHPLLWQSYASSTGATGTATGREFKVKLSLDKAVAQTTVLNFTLSGTAVKNSASAVGDYDVDGTTLTIDKGSAEAYITLTLYEDFDYYEFDNSDDLFKTVIITLGTVVSGPATVSTTNNVYTLTINEDDLLAVLQWNSAGSSGTDLDVDMDMLLWNGSTYAGLRSASQYTAAEYTNTNKVGYEGINIPGGFPNATYGFSYIYYKGSSDPLNFNVGFFGTLDGKDYTQEAKVFSGSYGLGNINVYDDATNGKQPQIVQTVVKNGLNFTNASSITKPASGSRFINGIFSLPKKSNDQKAFIYKGGIF